MARGPHDFDKVLGIIAIVLGVLVLLGKLPFISWIIEVIGIVLIVVGILILVNVLRGSTMKGVVFLVLGILLAINFIGIPGLIATVLNIVIGIVLILYGIFLLK